MRKSVLLAPLTVLLLVACQSAPPDTGDGPIKLGFLGPLTGGAAPYGNDILHAIEMRVNEQNEQGGLGGRTIDLIVEDAKCTGTEAASAAQRLISVEKVVAIVGAGCSGEMLAAAPIAEEAEVVFLTPMATSPDISDAGDFIFRVIPHDGLAAVATASYFADADLTKVAMISENTDFATAFQQALIQEIGEANVAFDEVVEPETKDFRSLMTRLEEVEFDVFVANGQGVGVIAEMAKQLRAAGFEQPIVTNNAGDSNTLGEIGGEATYGMRVVGAPNFGADDPDAFPSKFEAIYGEPQQGLGYVTLGYDAAGVMLQALSEVGTDGPAIRDYFYSLEGYDGIAGTFSFNENGDVEGLPLALKEVTADGIVIVDLIPLE